MKKGMASGASGHGAKSAHIGGGPIAQSVHSALDRYFSDLDGATPGALYDLVLPEVEAPLLEYVMRKTDQNQCAAAKLLGINRNTLRKKLLRYGLLT